MQMPETDQSPSRASYVDTADHDRDIAPEGLAMSWARRATNLAVAVACVQLVAATVAVGPAVATHSIACAGQIETHWAGQSRESSQGLDVTGIRATLEGQGIDPCTGAGGGTVTWLWVAIEGPCSECIMQVGLGRYQGETMGYWRAWGRNTDAPGCESYSHVSPGSYRLEDWSGNSAVYEISLSSGTWYYKIGGVTKYTVWDGNICWRNFLVDWFGENYNLGSAIGGTPLNFHNVTANRYRVLGDATWYSPGWGSGHCAIENPVPPYYCTKAGADQLNFWTDH
jgi:hypothetical protein